MKPSEINYYLKRLGTQEPGTLGRISEYTGKRVYPILSGGVIVYMSEVPPTLLEQVLRNKADKVISLDWHL
ncbi:hypothetical protein HYW20_04770 [Candidatus Woesearchaeota archaeon]|nr:hypothetical protein [Candidatus Woesearchaeota archaeon]